MIVKIPFAPKAEATKHLPRILELTAEGTPLTAEQVAIVMSRFLQFLSVEVSAGHAVLIPGFGLFCAVNACHTHVRRDGKQVYAFAKPRFAPSRGFRADVRAHCPPYPEAETIFNRYTKRHTARGLERDRERFPSVRKAMSAFRGNFYKNVPYLDDRWRRPSIEELRKNAERPPA